MERIVALERRAFAPALQADRDMVRRRFALGHIMYAVQDGEDLHGLISYSYARFSPEDREGFPRTFRDFSTLPVPRDFNAAFIYNLEVDPAARGGRAAPVLVRTVLDRAKRDGCTWAVADGRPSSYRGSMPCAQERVQHDPEFARAIDGHLRGGPFPSRAQLLRDPTLALYHRLTGCEFLWVLPDFVPEDGAAGGMRVILYGNLTEDWPVRRKSGR
jgi:GNAT superfamily N-acetyltransferase